MILTLPLWLQYLGPAFLPIYIFLARTTDMTLNTIRIIVVGRGRKYLAFILGFLELMVWLTAIGAALTDLGNPIIMVAYAGGFAMGNFVGITIEEKWIMGKMLLRIFATQDELKIVQNIQKEGYGTTTVEAQGSSGPVKMVYTIIDRKDFKRIGEKLQTLHPKLFYTVEGIRNSKEGIFPARKSGFFRV